MTIETKLILTTLFWIGVIVAFAMAGNWLANVADRIERKHAPPNPEVVEALEALGYKKQNAVRLAKRVDPDLDVEIALQVIFSEYGEL